METTNYFIPISQALNLTISRFRLFIFGVSFEEAQLLTIQNTQAFKLKKVKAW